MKLEIERKENFPLLGWGAIVDFDKRLINAFIGPDIDESDKGFIEGCHTGEHILDDVLNSPFCLATGLILDEGQPVFFAASHTLDPLYYIHHNNALYISNSLPCVLAISDHELDPDHFYYATDFSKIQDHVNKIPLKKGTLNVAHHINLKILDDGSVEPLKKVGYGPFATYTDYEAALKDAIVGVLRNAKLPGRKNTYDPISTLSSGYDSVAIAAIVKELAKDNLTEALTIRDAGKNLGDKNDSGAEIAKILGLKVTEQNRMDYRKKFDSELLLSFTGSPQDLPLSIFKDKFVHKLLLRGDHGDVIWVYNLKPSTFKRSTMSGLNTNEFRHHMGYINVPIPYIGLEYHADIINISKSDEMAPWRLNNSYDRPVARRLAEDRGVPRQLFGQQKKATVVSDYDESYFSKELSVALEKRWTEIQKPNVFRIFRGNVLYRLFWMQSWMINKYVSLIRRLGFKTYDLKYRLIPRRYSQRIDKWSLLAHLSNEELKKFYQI